MSVLSLVATEVVREAQQRHNASPTVCSKFALPSPLCCSTPSLSNEEWLCKIVFKNVRVVSPVRFAKLCFKRSQLSNFLN